MTLLFICLFVLFVCLCFLEEKESKTFLGGCDRNKALRVGFMLDHISRFFHSVDKPGVWSFPACRRPSSVLPLPCAAFAWSPALALVALQSSFPVQKQRAAGAPCSTEEIQRVSQAWRQLQFLELLVLNGTTWACASPWELGTAQPWHLTLIV